MQAHCSLEAAFASVSLAAEIRAESYPMLARVWGYHGTAVDSASVGELRADLLRLIKAAARDHADPDVMGELDALFAFVKTAEALGLGLRVSGP